MSRIAPVFTFVGFFLICSPLVAQHRYAEKDRQALITLENEWLHANDAATLDRILASGFVDVVPVDHFLAGTFGIVNGTVVANDPKGKELDRTVFTDVFAYREGRWQAVNAQENQIRPMTQPEKH